MKSVRDLGAGQAQYSSTSSTVPVILLQAAPRLRRPYAVS